MTARHAALIASALAALSGAALASSGSLVQFKPQVMPVLVQVNAQGRVTDIQPSFQLTPWSRELLSQQLDAWINRPAIDHGRPVASRFIIEVAMQTRPRNDGHYDANFVYVKTLPLAYGGALHWDVLDGGLEVALVRDESGHTEWHAPVTSDQLPVMFTPHQARTATAAAAPDVHTSAQAAMPRLTSQPGYDHATMMAPTHASGVRIR